MTAREKFTKGQRVRLTELAIERGISQQHSMGIVVGFGHQSYGVMIRPDGVKTAKNYHMDFWESAK